MMYTAFRVDTGMSAYWFDAPQQPADTDEFVYFEGEHRTSALLNGQPVHIGPRPSYHHKFSTQQFAWVQDHESAWAGVRNERQSLLQASDWSTLPDVPLTTEKRTEWATYRQALRDVTLQADPFNIVWPVAPT